jgi:2-oxoglutarate dehydrogenase E2 component (dihydrolipoamide succinyltransferase)
MESNRESPKGPLTAVPGALGSMDAEAALTAECDADVVTPAAEPPSEPEAPADVPATDPGFDAGPDVEAEPRELTPQPAAETLSPAVRRLVRQYDLDITGIHGTGPSGRIRVGDVIGMLGDRTDTGIRLGDAARGGSTGQDDRGDEPAGERERPAPQVPAARFAASIPASTVFECDLSRVLSHRRRQRGNNVEVLLTSYWVAACGEALRLVPEVATVHAGASATLGVLLSSSDGGLRTTLVDAPLGALDDRLYALDRQLRATGDADLARASMLIHHYGLSGSLLATPTPLGPEHAASVGIGRVRREIAVKTVDTGEEAPRVTAVCYVTLTFLPDRIAFNRANLFVATLVRTLETWPD